MPQNIIAIMYDFDQTLSPHYMQKPLLEKYGINEEQFWDEADRIAKEAGRNGTNVDQECAYMNHILKYVKAGVFRNLSNQELRELGRKIQLYPGLPDYFSDISRLISKNKKYQPSGITLEHYVISTGLKQMVLGSAIGLHLKDVFASEFLEENREIAYIGRAVGFIKKTEYLHHVNKGTNVDSSIKINDKLPLEQRRIPFSNMIYIGDGFTDVPCFATLNHREGISLAVYDSNCPNTETQAKKLLEDGRVKAYAPADYRIGSPLFEIILANLKVIADKILRICLAS